MSSYVKEAYKLGYRFGSFTKSAAVGGFLSDLQNVVSPYLSEDNVKKMLMYSALGGLGGAFIGGPEHRGRGLLTGALLASIASNPQLFGHAADYSLQRLFNFMQNRYAAPSDKSDSNSTPPSPPEAGNTGPDETKPSA